MELSQHALDNTYESNQEDQGQQPQQQQQAALQNVRQLGQMNMPDGAVPFHVLSIIGQVEGHMVLPPRNKTTKYEHVIPQLVAIEQNPKIHGLLVILNTVGGDIEAGLAIAEMIKTMTKPTVSLVIGGGHSIGTPIAVAADYCFISETATMTIHPIRLTGLVIGVPQTYDYLDKMQDRVIRFIVDNSRVSEDQLRDMMFRTGELVRDVGTVLIGEDALRCGLIDELGGLGQAVSKLQMLTQNREMAKSSKRQRLALNIGYNRAQNQPMQYPTYQPIQYPELQPYNPGQPSYPYQPQYAQPTQYNQGPGGM